MALRLTLDSFSTPTATLGFITFPEIFRGLPGLYTIERPWLENRVLESCIPGGFYKLKPFSGPTFEDVFILVGESVGEVEKEVHRSVCLLHIANWVHEVRGCIGLGLSLGSLISKRSGKPEPATLGSTDALKVIRALIEPNVGDAYLTINRSFEPPRWRKPIV